MRLLRTIVFLWVFFCITDTSYAKKDFIIIGSTTSTENSGFYQHILPIVQKETGIEIRVVAVGTGKALALAKRGDVDILIVHAKEDEEKFVNNGYGIRRKDLMFNEFFIVGPEEDPANIKNEKIIYNVLWKIHESAMKNSKIKFLSRGDESGTHKRELGIWKEAGIDPDELKGKWYSEVGGGMGRTLMIAGELGAYTLTDSATWMNLKNKNGLRILYKNAKELLNQYGIILLTKDSKKQLTNQFFDWMTSSEGKKAIEDFKIRGNKAFFTEK
jgi:tungstate transport system substrate-binding protein|tara:strand:+ start:845 stop:1660 length:816 start_codon:yes stop_codon:yes gene_type:complete